MQLLLITDYMIWLWDTNLGGTMTRENSDSSFEEEQISSFKSMSIFSDLIGEKIGMKCRTTFQSCWNSRVEIFRRISE